MTLYQPPSLPCAPTLRCTAHRASRTWRHTGSKSSCCSRQSSGCWHCTSGTSSH